MKLDLPEGVYVRGKSVYISFNIHGHRFRPVIKGLQPVKSDLRFAAKKRSSILYEIAAGKFVWQSHFSQPPPHKLYAHVPSNPIEGKTVSQALEELLAHYELERAPSTVAGYKVKMNRIKDRFSLYLLSELLPSDVSHWIENDLRHLENKTINEIFVPFRAMLRRARRDLIATRNGCEQIDAVLLELKNKVIENDQVPDPFLQEEIGRIVGCGSVWQQEVNMFLFGCNSGLSISELVAMGWEDVDLKSGTGICQRAKVAGKYKVTKTRRRNRQLEFTDQAVEVLAKQKELTYLRPALSIEVLQRDNRNRKKVNHRPIFLNSKTQQPHYGDNTINSEIFAEVLRKAGVRYRGINKARHTFISRMLTIDMPREWIITQTGHTDDKMITKHYGNYLNQERPDVSALASQRLRDLIEKPDKDGHKTVTEISKSP